MTRLFKEKELRENAAAQAIQEIADLLNELDEKEENDDPSNDEEHEALVTIRWILAALAESGYEG